MKKVSLAFAVFSALTMAPTVTRANENPPLRVVQSVDLSRYAGQWYEIARLPNRFQKKCAGEVAANYTLRPDGKITVINRCREVDGGLREAMGVARAAGKNGSNAILKVRFAPSFLSFLPWVWGDYQVIALAEDYSYVMVGTPDRRYLWILARAPRLDETIYNQLMAEARGQGFDVSRLQKTRQK